MEKAKKSDLELLREGTEKFKKAIEIIHGICEEWDKKYKENKDEKNKTP